MGSLIESRRQIMFAMEVDTVNVLKRFACDVLATLASLVCFCRHARVCTFIASLRFELERCIAELQVLKFG